jgi:HK97 gp10 family phage protein
MKYLTGDERLHKKLRQLIEAGDKSAGKAMRKGATKIAGAIRKEAPVGPSKTLKKSIGSKVKRSAKRGITDARAGIGVGKKKAKTARHGHLVGLGTTLRRRKKLGGKFAGVDNPSDTQLSTGTMPSNDFVKRGFRKGAAAALHAIRAEMAKQVNAAAKRGTAQ